jgi:formate hydrogenlyase subunit 4
VGRLPFDTTEAETEIMEGPLAEYSGPKLALFKWAHMAKLFVYAVLVAALFVPGPLTAYYPVNLVLLLAEAAVLVLLVTVVAAVNARYRIDQAIRYYAVLFMVALAGLVLAILGY